MKRLFLTLLSATFLLAAHAQLNGNGYYRVQNVASTRYITVLDNRGSVDYQSTTADMQAIKTILGFDKVVNDPASIIYIQQVGTSSGVGQYNLFCQGIDTKVITGGRYLSLRQTPKGYLAYGTAAGMTLYLTDEESIGEPLEVGNLVQNGTTEYRYWNILPVDQTDNQYFGVKSEVVASGQKYTSLFASFPFTLQSAGMKAFTVTKVNGDMAVWQELSGTIPASTPVILLCAGDDTDSNRLNIVDVATTAPADNLLKGVYFCNGNPGDKHFNKTTYDPQTMRLLGVTSEGKLGFVKSDVEYVPRNRAYLVVPEGSPDEIRLVTQAEYEAEMAKDDVVVTANSYSRLYGDENPVFDYTTTGHALKGDPDLTCAATVASPVGTYDIVVSRGSVTNEEATFVNGTLTVTPAPLTISAGNYTIKQNEPLPEFVASYSGFKVNDDATVLTAQPVLTTDAPADKTPGTYTVSVSGAAANNYDISYVSGTLTILEADPITIKAVDAQMTYGDELPQLTYTIEGGSLQGEPTLTCEATRESAAGTYAIVVAKGSIDYPNLRLENGTLTIAKAPLSVMAGNYTMKQTDARPEFKATYEGFKLNDTESSLTKQPVFSTDAPADNAPGEYVVTVSGAESLNYEMTYHPGRLVIAAVDEIVIMANDATMTYGDEVPSLTYTIDGNLSEGEPIISCEATSQSAVGTYAIHLEKGSITYPNVRLVDALLTVTQAPLTVSVDDCSREQGQPNPEFVLRYDGFRNGDTEDVLTEKPVATTDAGLDALPGQYVITVSGGSAQNYYLEYQNGVLNVTTPNSIRTTMLFAHPVDVYSLAGRKVRSQVTSLESLPSGIYMIEGRKFVVR